MYTTYIHMFIFLFKLKQKGRGNSWLFAFPASVYTWKRWAPTPIGSWQLAGITKKAHYKRCFGPVTTFVTFWSYARPPCFILSTTLPKGISGIPVYCSSSLASLSTWVWTSCYRAFVFYILFSLLFYDAECVEDLSGRIPRSQLNGKDEEKWSNGKGQVIKSKWQDREKKKAKRFNLELFSSFDCERVNPCRVASLLIDERLGEAAGEIYKKVKLSRKLRRPLSSS